MPVVVHVDEKKSTATVELVDGERRVIPFYMFDFIPKVGDLGIIEGEGDDVCVKSYTLKNLLAGAVKSDNTDGGAHSCNRSLREFEKYPGSVAVVAGICMVVGLLLNVYLAYTYGSTVRFYASLNSDYLKLPPLVEYLYYYFCISSVVSLAAFFLCLRRIGNSKRIGIPFFLVLFFFVSIPGAVLLFLASNRLFSKVRVKSERLCVTSVDNAGGKAWTGRRMLRTDAFPFRPKTGDVIDYYDDGTRVLAERVYSPLGYDDADSDYLYWTDSVAIWCKFFICLSAFFGLFYVCQWVTDAEFVRMHMETLKLNPNLGAFASCAGLYTAVLCWHKINASRKVPLWMQVLAFFSLGPLVGAIMFVVNGRACRSCLYREIKNKFISKIPFGLLRRKTFWVKVFLFVGIAFMSVALYRQLGLFWDKFDVSLIGFRGLEWKSLSKTHEQMFNQTVVLIIWTVIGLGVTFRCLNNMKYSRTNSLWVKIPVMLMVNIFAGIILLAFDHELPDVEKCRIIRKHPEGSGSSEKSAD